MKIIDLSKATITTDKDLQLLLDCAPKECGGFIDVFDDATTATLRFYYDYDLMLWAAIERYKSDYQDQEVKQCNILRFIVEKDGEESPFDFVEFFPASLQYKHGITYASDEEAESIYKGKVKIDWSLIYDYELPRESIS